MKTIAFAGSNSSTSINHQLVSYAVKLVEDSEVIKLTDYNAPMYSQDLEKSEGIPQVIKDLNDKLSEANKLVISVCEHNGNISAFFKNILEWLS
jgi:NAD(P)H-dependent FMN reductase